MEMINAIGRRKAAVARVYLTEGTGKITINKRDLKDYFPSELVQFVVKQPLNLLNVADKYDVKVNLYGGGFTGQSQALLFCFLFLPLADENNRTQCQHPDRYRDDPVAAGGEGGIG